MVVLHTYIFLLTPIILLDWIRDTRKWISWRDRIQLDIRRWSASKRVCLLAVS